MTDRKLQSIIGFVAIVVASIAMYRIHLNNTEVERKSNREPLLTFTVECPNLPVSQVAGNYTTTTVIGGGGKIHVLRNDQTVAIYPADCSIHSN